LPNLRENAKIGPDKLLTTRTSSNERSSIDVDDNLFVERERMAKFFSYRFIIPDDANDANGHVNNIAYVQWMQDVAIRHSDAQNMYGREVSATWQQLGRALASD